MRLAVGVEKRCKRIATKDRKKSISVLLSPHQVCLSARWRKPHHLTHKGWKFEYIGGSGV